MRHATYMCDSSFGVHVRMQPIVWIWDVDGRQRIVFFSTLPRSAEVRPPRAPTAPCVLMMGNAAEGAVPMNVRAEKFLGKTHS